MSKANKKSFLMGLGVGVGVLVIAGFFVMLFMYMDIKNDKMGGEAADKKVAADGSAPSGGDNQVVVSADDHIRGNQNAPITIVEFSDIQCPFCSRHHTTMKKVLENYPDDVRWVYKHFPLDSIHPYARVAAEATECAAEQGKFWEYIDNLFDNQSKLNKAYLSTAAGELGLNIGQFDDCLSSGKYKSKVNDDYQAGIKLGVTGTPGNFINGRAVPGAVPYEQIQSIVESLK